MGFYCGSDGKESTWNVGDLGWEIPWSRTWQPTPVFLPGESPCTEETGGLQSMGSQRAGHDWATKHSTYSFKNIFSKIWKAFFKKYTTGVFKITVKCDCSHEIKKNKTKQNRTKQNKKKLLLLGRKAMTNLDSTLKSRDITLLTNVHLVKAMVFPVAMDRYESWTIKKAELQRINAFEQLEKTLESPLDSKEIKPVSPKVNQTWIFIGRTNAETPILWPLYVKKLTCWKKPWCQKRMGAGGEGDDRVWDGWMAPLNQWTWVWANSQVGDGQESLVCCSPWGQKELKTT